MSPDALLESLPAAVHHVAEHAPVTHHGVECARVQGTHVYDIDEQAVLDPVAESGLRVSLESIPLALSQLVEVAHDQRGVVRKGHS